MAKKEKKLDVFRVLKALDENDLDFYSTLNEVEQKEFSGWLTMRWASSSLTEPEHYLLMINAIVNDSFSEFKDHPEMIWKLLAICGMGRSVRHKWIPPMKGKRKSRGALAKCIAEIKPQYKADEVDLFLRINNEADIREVLENAGYEDKEIKELLK